MKNLSKYNLNEIENLSNFSALDANSLDTINGGSWKTKALKYAGKAALEVIDFLLDAEPAY